MGGPPPALQPSLPLYMYAKTFVFVSHAGEPACVLADAGGRSVVGADCSYPANLSWLDDQS